MSRLQEGEREGESSKLKFKRHQLVEDSGSIGVVRNEDSSYGQFHREAFEGLVRDTIKIDDVPQLQYDSDPDSVTAVKDHSPPIGPSSPTKASLQEGEFAKPRARPSPLQEGEQEGNNTRSRVGRTYPVGQFRNQSDEAGDAYRQETDDQE